MRAEVRARALRIAALAFTALAAFAHDVRAQYVTGYLKGQFQVFEDQALVPNGDGTFRTDWKRTERWTQTIELQHVAQPRSDLRVMSNFRYTDLSYSKLPDASRSPQGSVQVTHPWASLFAAYRPSTVTGGLGATGVSAGDSARAGAITARSQETMLLGQIAPPNLPRLDVSWNRRHRNADVLSPEEAGVNRNARLSWTRGALSSYASLGDQSIDHPAQNTRGTTQRTGGAGAALHLTPTRQTAMDLQYDFAAELALADQPAALVERINAKLLLGAMPAELKAEIQGAIEKMAIPALRADASNQRQVNDAKRARVNAAVFLAVISPEFQVQK